MINSFRRKRTEAAAAVRAVRAAAAVRTEADGSGRGSRRIFFFFLCCCFCGCRLSAAAAGSHPTDDGKIHRLVQQKRPQVVQLVGLQQPDGRIHRTGHVQVAQQPDGRIHRTRPQAFSCSGSSSEGEGSKTAL